MWFHAKKNHVLFISKRDVSSRKEMKQSNWCSQWLRNKTHAMVFDLNIQMSMQVFYIFKFIDFLYIDYWYNNKDSSNPTHRSWTRFKLCIWDFKIGVYESRFPVVNHEESATTVKLGCVFSSLANFFVRA